jgi:hypothetical protein
MPTESTPETPFRKATRIRLLLFALLICGACGVHFSRAGELSHPRLMTDRAGIDSARKWINADPWYRDIFEQHRADVDRFIARRPVYVSPLKQTYVFEMYTCPKHGVELMFEEFKPFEHRCPVDTTEFYAGGKYDMAWAGWYNRLLGTELVWMGLLYNIYGEEKYADAGREILMRFADLYLRYSTENTILGPAHVFFGTLSESFWGVDMVYAYDLLYNYRGFTPGDRKALEEKFFFPLARITQQFPETASNRQLWYNNVSAAVGFLYGDRALIDFAIEGKYGFTWQLGTALPLSGFWPEWSGYHFVALRGMIHLAEMARHNGYDLYHMEIAGKSMKKMFDAPFLLIQPNFEFPRSKDSGGGSILEYAPFYEVGYAVYRDPQYLGLLNLSHLKRGTQLVGETSALGRAPEPVSMFDIVPDLPAGTVPVYPEQSINLEGNGFAVLRDGARRTYLYLDYGIQGGEHGHPDRLQMGYYGGGRNWIVDPLNESYMNPNLQLWYHRSIAHNTLVVDQTDQAWTNGYGNFFGALPLLQVASGGSTTEYAGVRLTRTLLQAGDYFLDIFDADAPEGHTYDLPLHSFGALTLEGVVVERQPADLFGNKPGIPGYDQLTDIYQGESDSTFQGVFTDKGGHLMVRVIGEPGTRIFKAMTPPIGGFYKQMVADRIPMPMLMTRRITRGTRFASLIEAYGTEPTVSAFSRGKDPGTYIIRQGGKTDLIHIDIGNSQYSIVREEGGLTTFAAGFNIRELRQGERVLISSQLPLDEIQCTWKERDILLTVPRPFSRLRVLAPQAGSLSVNGSAASFRQEGEYAVVYGISRRAVKITSPRDSMLFLGRKNAVRVTVSNMGDEPVAGKVTLALAPDWKDRMRSQTGWWGGIVNLVATNKGPVERQTFPADHRSDAAWIDGLSSGAQSIPAGESGSVTLNLEVPNDAAPVTYSAIVSFGKDTVRKSFVVRPPVTASLMLRNAEKEGLSVDLTNHTTDRLIVSTQLTVDPAWKTTGDVDRKLTLKPLETVRVHIPLRLAGYTKDNQLYPVRLGVKSEGFASEITHDFYVGVARYAKTPPSLDGSWNGWNRTEPMLIDRPSQIGRLLFGNQPWHGAPDLSSGIFAMYDRTYLYVGAAVTDDSVVAHWDFPRMQYPWDSDCMEIVVDVRVNSTQGHDPPTPGAFRHLSLAEYRETDFSALAWQGAGAQPLVKPNLVPGGETYFHRTRNGYAMIARFPLASLPGIVAKPGYKIGFDVAINDNDGTSFRKNQHIWAGYDQNQSWWDLGTIGALVFGPDN